MGPIQPTKTVWGMRHLLNSTLGMTALVAFVAVVCVFFVALEREHGNPNVGLLLVVASVAGVALLRANEVITECRIAERCAGKRWPLARFLFTSLGVAMLIVGLADAAFISAYGLLAGGPKFFLISAGVSKTNICIPGLVAGCAAALVVCYLSRWAFWHPSRLGHQLLRGSASVSLVLLLCGSNGLCERISYRRHKAEHHNFLAARCGADGSFPGILSDEDLAAYRALAAYHFRMRQKWDYAAARPWLPVEPDPPPPNDL